jgi:hypothetical protein
MKIEIFNGRIIRSDDETDQGSTLFVAATIHGLVPTVIVDGRQVTGPVNGQPEGRLRPSSGPVADVGTVPSQTAG